MHDARSLVQPPLCVTRLAGPFGRSGTLMSWLAVTTLFKQGFKLNSQPVPMLLLPAGLC